MTIQLTKRLLTTEEYHKMEEVGILGEDDRIELIHGEIIEMSPIGSQHAGCINRINAILHQLLSNQVIISVQNPLKIDERSEPEPDIAILKPKPDFYANQHPLPKDVLLIIEVADSSIEYDREMKIPMYANAGIPEYWIVNLQRSEIEVYRDPKENTYGIKATVDKTGDLQAATLNVNVSARDLLG